jgi:hypothetical protein
MRKKNTATVPERVTLRLDKDTRQLLQRALRALGSRNKNKVGNACLRLCLEGYATRGKPIDVAKSDLDRRIEQEGKL